MFKSREFRNGTIIFVGIGIYFLLMEMLGLSNHFYLRILNVFIVLYGTNRTIKANIYEGQNDYLFNLTSGAMSCFHRGNPECYCSEYLHSLAWRCRIH